LQAQTSGWVNPERKFAYSGFERHTHNARLEGRGYPSRALHTDEFLYIKNLAPDRWPAGRPPDFGDIDDGSPTKIFLISKRREFEQHWQGDKQGDEESYQSPSLDDSAIDLATNPGYALILAGAKRPAEELYAIKRDPGQLHNLASNPAYDAIRKKLAQQLADEMKRTQDPWATGQGAVFDSYLYYAPEKGE